MSLRVATPELVHQQVRAVLEKVPTARALAVRAEPRWTGGTLDVDGRTVAVRPCTSPLAVRATLADHLDPTGGDGTPRDRGAAVVVIVCDLADADLGHDVLARLAGARVWGLEPWNAVQGLFGVRRLDAAFRKDQGWIAEALLTHVPADTARSLTGRAVLSVEVALDALARQILGADHLSIDGVIAATSADTGSAPFARLADVAPETRDGLLGALADRHGPLGELVAAIVGNGHGADLLAVGVAARAVYGQGEHDGGRPAGRLEARLGIAAIEPTTAAALATRCEEALGELARTDTDRAGQVLAIATALAADVDAAHPEASAWLPAGYDRRLEVAAGLIDVALDRLAAVAGATGTAPGVDDQLRNLVADVATAVDRVADHRSATTGAGRRRLAHLRMAARLLTWLASPEGAEGRGLGAAPAAGPVSFEEAAAAYAAEGAWVDRARRRLWHGDADPALGATYRRVIDAVVARRRPQNQRFAELLAAWTTTPGAPATRTRHRLVCVEDVAAQIVAPLARATPAEPTPVLVVVLDGCGLSSFGELAGQFAELGYRELVTTGDDGTPSPRWSGVAALPTVTEVSRASLLAGQLDQGNQDHERRAFERCEALRIDGRPGVLFHQNRLLGPAGVALAPEVTAALAGSGPAVVGVVVNTIDDHLKRGTFPDELRLDDLTALVPLLETARTHGRTVVVTADHGHVLAQPDDGGTGSFQGGGTGGERWRHADRAPEPAEVLLRGDRVVLGGTAGVLAPWDDDFRYGAKAGGYHGGATPEEVLVPVAVFAPAGLDPRPGWEHAAPATPLWWDLRLPAAVTAPADTAAAPPPPAKPRRRPKVDESQPAMFEVPAPTTPEPAPTLVPAGSAAPGEPAWVPALLTSEVWQLQRDATGARAPLAEDRVRAVLSALHRRGGVASFATITTEAAVPAARLAGFLTHLARILNVDGYAVLEVDAPAGEARLSLPLLAQQFEITVTAP